VGRDPDVARIHEFVDLIGAAARSPRRRRRILRASGVAIAPASLSVLQLLGRRGSAAPSDLARWLELDASTVSRQLRPLEENGLVVRSTGDSPDKRVARFSLTDAGRQILSNVHAVGEHDLEVALTGFSADDRRDLADLLERLREAMVSARMDANGVAIPGEAAAIPLQDAAP
jgi:DNA-binding MarR family transcriptional regulator